MVFAQEANLTQPLQRVAHERCSTCLLVLFFIIRLFLTTEAMVLRFFRILLQAHAWKGIYFDVVLRWDSSSEWNFMVSYGLSSLGDGIRLLELRGT